MAQEGYGDKEAVKGKSGSMNSWRSNRETSRPFTLGGVTDGFT